MAAHAAKHQLTLIGHGAFRPFRNVWMLEELGVPYEHVEARPHSAEASARHPMGKIPSLIDGDLVTMYESAAINTYLGDRFRGHPGAPELVPPAGSPLRGRYEMLTHFISAEIDAQALWIHRKHGALGHVFGDIPEAVVAAKVQFDRAMGTVTGELGRSGGEYLLGGSFSAADILLVHCVNWAQSIGWIPKERSAPPGEDAVPFDYLERCWARPAYLRAAAKR